MPYQYSDSLAFQIELRCVLFAMITFISREPDEVHLWQIQLFGCNFKRHIPVYEFPKFTVLARLKPTTEVQETLCRASQSNSVKVFIWAMVENY